MKSSSSNINNKKSTVPLVADQPGLVVLILGVALSALFGFFIRGLFSDEKVLEKITQAARQIHPELSVEVGSATMSLSSHGLPRFAVIVKNVRMVSENECWMRPLLTINEIVVPLSLTQLMNGDSPVKELLVDAVDLDLRATASVCKMQNLEKKNSLLPTSEESSAQANIKIETEVHPVNPGLKEIQISHLRLFNIQRFSQPLLFDDLRLQVKSDQPKIIVLKAQTQLSEDGAKKDYTSKGEIYVEYNEFPEKILIAHFLGQFREGHFTVHLQNRIDEKRYNLEMELKHLPMSKLSSWLHQFNQMTHMDPKQLWLSLKAHSSGQIDQIEKEELEIKDIQMEGEMGVFNIKEISITALNPLAWKPFIIDARDLDLRKMLSYLQNYKQPQTLGGLGLFNGRIEVYSPQELRLFGLHKGLEFVFSSQGIRENQLLNQVSVDAHLKNKFWTVKLSRVELDQGLFSGDVVLKSDNEFKNAQLRLNLDQLILSPKVQKVLTQGGTVDSLSSRMQFEWKNRELVGMNGFLNCQKFEMKDVLLSGLRFESSPLTAEGISFQGRFNQIHMPVQFLKKYNFPLGESVQADENLVRFEKVSGIFRWHSKEFYWSQLQAGLTNNMARLSSSGGWNEAGEVDGQVNWVSTTRGNKNSWKIRGLRDSPQFVQE